MAGMITIPHESADIPAYLALPPAGHGPGLLFGHAWWGLSDTFKRLADGLAAAGFVVLAPDLFRGTVATTIAEAEQAAGQAEENYAELEAEVNAAARYLSQLPETDGPHIGAIGFSFGCHYVLNASEKCPDVVRAVVVCYGTGGWGFDAAQAAYQGHFAEHDEWEDDASREAFAERLTSAGRSYEGFVYPGTHHWFAEPNRPEYDPTAAALAQGRTIAFLKQQLLG